MTSGVTDTPKSGEPPAVSELVWHTLGADQVLHSEGVDAQRGLTSSEAGARAERFGPNTFAAGRAESRWRAFAGQYADPMQLVLLAVGIGSLSEVLGPAAAAAELRQHAGYAWIYGQILDDPGWFAGFLHRHGLRVPGQPPLPRRLVGEPLWAGNR